MKFSETFPKPKFQIGQLVKIMENYTKRIIEDKTYIVVQITLSCLSVLGAYPKEEPFSYMLLNEESLGKKFNQQELKWDIRESFIVAVE